MPPPPVRGIGNAGGFKIQLEDRSGVGLRQVLAASADLMQRADQDPNLARVFTTFGANSPQMYLEIDRTKARMLNVPLSNVFDTLQINLGSAYVNDFNFLGRVNQVRAQADQDFRMDREDILRLKTRSAAGALVPLGSLVNIRDVAGPDLVQRYNLFPSVPVQGDTRPGVSSGQALDAMERLAQSLRKVSATSGRNSPISSERPAARPPTSSALRCCSCSWCSRRNTRAGPCRSPSC